MEVVHSHCCGMDVHKKNVKACIMTPQLKEIRTFSTMTGDLMKLKDWLKQCAVTDVAMESTGVYWKPIYNLLEDEFGVIVVNAKHIKNVPGRKTDVKDAEWIADLLKHGLVKASFIPDRGQRELRELVRYRRGLIQDRSALVNRIQKVLEGANIKLSSVATNVMGVSGRAMLQAMIEGNENPEELAELAQGKLRDKHTDLVAALQGLMAAHQRMLLESLLRHMDFLDSEIERLDNEVSTRMEPFKDQIERLDEIHGVGKRSSEEILAEIGTDMKRFPSAAHLASWAKICPGNNESAGKRKSGRTGHGNNWLRSVLVQVAWAASRTKKTYLSALYRRMAGRKGAKRAIIAVAHAILVTIYTMLTDNTSYRDLGANHFDQLNLQYVLKNAINRIERLGFKATIEPIPVQEVS
jgi:transposase